MASFLPAFQKTLLNEGGYVNDPADAGGETYKGVARNIFPQWQGWTIVDGLKNQPNFPANLDDSAVLQNDISDFYLSNFWNKVHGDQINDQRVASSIFDFAVNAGVKKSAMLAQQVVGADPDGVVGNMTLGKLNHFDPSLFLSQFTLAKITFYVSLVRQRPIDQKFFFGWVQRALNQ